MHERPYLLVRRAMSVNSYIDDASPDRLILSGESEDLDRVDEVRAPLRRDLRRRGRDCRDDPRLVIRAPGRRAPPAGPGRRGGIRSR